MRFYAQQYFLMMLTFLHIWPLGMSYSRRSPRVHANELCIHTLLLSPKGFILMLLHIRGICQSTGQPRYYFTAAREF